MAFGTQYTLSQDATFRGKVSIAMRKSALSIAGEAKGSKTPQEWFKRAALAAAVLRDPPINWIEQFALAVASNETITGTIDGDIEFQVNAIWSDIAGVTGQDVA